MSAIQDFKITLDKYGFILLALVIVLILDVICLWYRVPPESIVSLDGIMVTLVGYGVLKEAVSAARSS